MGLFERTLGNNSASNSEWLVGGQMSCTALGSGWSHCESGEHERWGGGVTEGWIGWLNVAFLVIADPHRRLQTHLHLTTTITTTTATPFPLLFFASRRRRADVDLMFFQLLSGMHHAFPKAMAAVEDVYPLCHALRDRVGEVDTVKAYRASDRCLPFSNEGVFRQYPQLDAAE